MLNACVERFHGEVDANKSLSAVVRCGLMIPRLHACTPVTFACNVIYI